MTELSDYKRLVEKPHIEQLRRTIDRITAERDAARKALELIEKIDRFWTRGGEHDLNGMEVLERSPVGNVLVRGACGKLASEALASTPAVSSEDRAAK